jgi:hypothetical protein
MFRYVNKYGDSTAERTRRHVKVAATAMHILISPITNSNAATILARFLAKSRDLSNRVAPFTRFFESFYKIQSAFKVFLNRQHMRVQFINLIIAKNIEKRLNAFLKERRKKSTALMMETYSRLSKQQMRDVMARKYFAVKQLDYKLNDLQHLYKFETIKSTKRFLELAQVIK